jgi:prefoldin alpha subunit
MSATDQSDEGVDVTQLNIPQLNQLRQQLQAENERLSQNYSSFKLAQNRLLESHKALQDIKPENAGKDVLVPLTQSLYVPGKLSNVKTVLVDVGTGYYFEKTSDQAREFFERKAAVVQDNADALEKIIRQKRKQYDVVTSILQQRIQQQAAQGPMQ